MGPTTLTARRRMLPSVGSRCLQLLRSQHGNAREFCKSDTCLVSWLRGRLTWYLLCSAHHRRAVGQEGGRLGFGLQRFDALGFRLADFGLVLPASELASDLCLLPLLSCQEYHIWRLRRGLYLDRRTHARHRTPERHGLILPLRSLLRDGHALAAACPRVGKDGVGRGTVPARRGLCPRRAARNAG